MRILRFDLIAFGPFTDTTLDFGDGRGLHLVLGQNEAGKSSALRGLRDFLFGIPQQSSDDFVHRYAEMRLGAELAGEDDPQPWRLIRRKGAKNTLLEADGEKPADMTRFQRMLGGVSADAFGRLFGLGHEQLVAGGREIVHGNGQWGAILFAAGSGVANLQAVQKQFEADAARLYLQKAKNPKINALLSAVEETRRKMKEFQVPSSEWLAHEKNLYEARQRLAEIDRQLQITREKKQRLERATAAIPLIAQRRDLLARREQLGLVRLLVDDFAKRRHEAVVRCAKERQSAEHYAKGLQLLESAIAKLPVDELLAAESQQIDRLQQSLGAYVRDQNDVPLLAGQQTQLHADAQSMLAELRPDITLADAEQLRFNKRRQTDIQRLSRNYQALLDERDRSRARVAEIKAGIAAAERTLTVSPSSQGADNLRARIERWQAQGDLDQQLSEQTATIAAAEQQAQVELAQIGLFNGTLEALESLPLPPEETHDRVQRQWESLERRRGTLAEKIAERDAEVADVERQIQQLQQTGAVPSEADLAAARALRQQGWQLVLADWKLPPKRNSKKVDADVVSAVVEFAGLFQTNDLATGYEGAVRAADDLADRLRSEAQRVQQMAGLCQRQQELHADLAKLAEQQSRLFEQQAAEARAWQELWQPTGITPLPPVEMRGWVIRQQRLAASSSALRILKLGAERLQGEIVRAIQELADQLARLRRTPAASPTSLAQALAAGQVELRALDKEAHQREKLLERIEQLRGELPDAEQAAARAEQQLTEWQTQWRGAIEPLGLPADATPEQAAAVLEEVNLLFDKLKEATDLQERIAGIRARGRLFEDELARLTRRVAPDLPLDDLPAAAEQLLIRLKRAADNSRARADLCDKRAEANNQFELATASLRQHEAELTALCQEAGCSSAEQLHEAEQRSTAAIQLQQRLENCEEQLLRLSAGLDLAKFIEQTAPLSADALPGELSQLAEQIVGLETIRQQLAEEIGAENNEFQRIDGNAAAALQAEELQQRLAGLEREAEQYAQLRLALCLLREGIQRFRERHQGPALARAGQLFAQLTRGSFDGLQVDYESDQPTLVGVRGQPPRGVRVQQMSDGTGDQLYLALRLAMLEQQLGTLGPLPLVLDDVLVNFDDARSAAALHVLAEFGSRMQVIFFTHHEHVVRLAQKELGSRAFVHTLAR